MILGFLDNLNPGQMLLVVLALFGVIGARKVWKWYRVFKPQWDAFQAWKTSAIAVATQPVSPTATMAIPIPAAPVIPITPHESLVLDLTSISREAVAGANGALQHPPVHLDTARAYIQKYVHHGRMSFPIGWWTDSQTIHLAVGHFIGDIYNILVTAMPGSGKDNLILNMAYSLMHDYSPEELQFFVMDGKGGADYLDWDKKQHVFHIAEEGYQLTEAMELLSAIKLDRKRWLKQARVSSWDNYRGADRPPLMIVIISELTQLLEVMTRSEVESWLMREVNVWRGLGLRLVVGTQNTSGWSKEWRAAMECFFAGLQPSGDEVRPNTGKTTKELEEVLQVVPPHRLPNVRGLFTAVHRNTAVNVRTTYLDDDQRMLLALRLPDRTPEQLMVQRREKARLVAAWQSFNRMINTSSDPHFVEHETSIAPRAAEEPATPMPSAVEGSSHGLGYDRLALERLLVAISQNRSRKLEELADEPLFIQACVVEYARVKSNSGVVRALWGEQGYSGTKDRVVKAALERASQTQRGIQDDTFLQGLLAA